MATAKLPKVGSKKSDSDNQVESTGPVFVVGDDSVSPVQDQSDTQASTQDASETEVPITAGQSVPSDTTPQPAVKFDDKNTGKSPIERNVKVALIKNHSCTIGGVTYHFEKGKQYNVPQSVKTILKQAGLLSAL